MLIGGLVEAFIGIDAEGRSLEDLALPLGSAGPPAARPGNLANVTGAPRPPAARTIAPGASLADVRSQAEGRRHRPRRERERERARGQTM
jgi:hypothetical protein